jgi:hypothetical protein
MLSKLAISILKWLDKQDDQYFSEYQIRKAGFNVDFSSLDWLFENDCLIRYILDEPYDPDTENPPYMYRISQGGKAKLTELRQHRFAEWRAWVTLAIALVGLTLSILTCVAK